MIGLKGSYDKTKQSHLGLVEIVFIQTLCDDAIHTKACCRIQRDGLITHHPMDLFLNQIGDLVGHFDFFHDVHCFAPPKCK